MLIMIELLTVSSYLERYLVGAGVRDHLVPSNYPRPRGWLGLH